MGLSGRLCNATPWEQVIPWHRNKITVPGDGHVELRADQLDDFRPGKPGSEEVRTMLEAFGCFLYDTDKSYDVQTFEAIQNTIRVKRTQYNEFLTNLRNEHVRAGRGNVTDADLEGAIEMQGYGHFFRQIESLENRLKKLKSALTATGELSQKRQAPKYDPDRTCFGTSPPREFATRLALELFLDENPEFESAHRTFINKMNESALSKAEASGRQAVKRATSAVDQLESV